MQRFVTHTYTLCPNPRGKWSMDQLSNSNTQYKEHWGISNVYHHYPNSPHPNEMNSRNWSEAPGVWIRVWTSEEAVTGAQEAAMMDGVRTGQRWHWLIRLWGQRSESQPNVAEMSWDACGGAWWIVRHSAVMEMEMWIFYYRICS